jgi:hypothetical protein
VRVPTDRLILVDATYEPVNELDTSRRNEVILRDYPLLCDDLKNLILDRSTPLVLIKENVCRILGPKLVEDKFNVINDGRVIYFPSHGRQKDFQRQFSAVLKAAGIGGEGAEAIRCDDGNDLRGLGDEEEIDSLELTYNWQPNPS